jgi:hypothetical protein
MILKLFFGLFFFGSTLLMIYLSIVAVADSNVYSTYIAASAGLMAGIALIVLQLEDIISQLKVSGENQDSNSKKLKMTVDSIFWNMEKQDVD